jgi:hypothetical protein
LFGGEQVLVKSDSVNAHFPGRWREDSDQHPQRGGLAGAVGTQQSHHFSGSNLQADAVYRHEGAELFDQIRGG